jgi:Cu+-exporting ATPase
MTKGQHQPVTTKRTQLVFDLVCGMELEKRLATQSIELNLTTYYFCSAHCKRHFENNPERYVWEK